MGRGTDDVCVTNVMKSYSMLHRHWSSLNSLFLDNSLETIAIFSVHTVLFCIKCITPVVLCCAVIL